MSIEFRCQNCGRRLRVRREKLGKQVACPRCKQRTEVTIPAESAGNSTDSSDDATNVASAESANPDRQTVSTPGEASDLPDKPNSAADVSIQLVYDRSEPTDSQASPSSTAISLTRTGVLTLTILIAGLPMCGFALGWLAGRAVPAVQAVRPRQPCFLSGQVTVRDEPDPNAVVLLFSATSSPPSREKLAVEILQPSAAVLKPTHNAVKQLHSWDGDLTRTDSDGRFTVRVPDKGAYYLLVLSTTLHKESAAIDRSDIAQLGRYVTRPANLIRNHRYLWQTLDVKGDVYDHDVDVSAVAENR
jgi:phage FluMu protein Com